MQKMHNPPHPGEFIHEMYLKPLGLSVTKTATGLGVSTGTLSRLLRGQISVSPEMAVRLGKAFGDDPETWLRHQLLYDVYHAEKKLRRVKIEALV